MTAALLFPPQTRNHDLSCNETLQPLRPIVVDIRLGHKNSVNKLRAAISQSFTNRSWHLAVCLRPWMQHLGDSIAFRIKRPVLGPIVKTETIDVVDKGFCRGVLGDGRTDRIDCPSVTVWLAAMPEKIGSPVSTSACDGDGRAMPSDTDMPT